MEGRDLASRVIGAAPGSRAFVAASRELAALAFSSDPGVAGPATTTIFRDLVEPWSDRFEPSLCDTYAVFMAEVLYAPASPVAAPLGDLGYGGPRDLLGRYRRIRRGATAEPLDRESVRAVIVLSRVTLGADIAVTSPVMRAALLAFPAARVHFIAPGKNIDLIAGGERVVGHPISYGRSALLADRLATWSQIRLRIRAITEGLAPGEWIVVDPDSRLTQLGLLPVADDDRYDFFESRAAEPESLAPLGTLSARWCAERWRVDAKAATPFARIRTGSGGVHEQLAVGRDRRVACVSFGVGDRQSKRLGAEFEDRLLALLRDRGYASVLDFGSGDAEARDAIERRRSFAGTKSHCDEGGPPGGEPAELVTWRGSLAGFGELISKSSLFVGYDSAAAHLAAAHAIPVISVFAGAPSDRFRFRWTPSGPGPVRVIPADGQVDLSSVLTGIAAALDEFEAGSRGSRNDRDRRW